VSRESAGLEFASPSGSRVVADTPISDQEIAILCDVLEGGGANLNADKRKVLDQQLVAKVPEKLNNFSPSAALD
jgi:hypothetical protein